LRKSEVEEMVREILRAGELFATGENLTKKFGGVE
jgi:hypothetical protein